MLSKLADWVMPLMVVGIVSYALIKKVRVFDCFMSGAKKGLLTVYELLPSITGLVLAVTMLTESSAMDVLTKLLTPVSEFFGVSPEVTPMAVLSPISGGGSLSLFESILRTHGPDSFLGRVGSVLMGSTDTTVYAVTVYYSAVNIKNTRHTLYAGLCADFASYVLSAFFVKLTLGV